MKTIVTCKIDVCKIEKKRLFEGKNGARYLDFTLIETENSKYGDDFIIVQAVSKEERLKGIKGPILGNAKYFTARTQGKPKPSEQPESFDNSDPIPF